VRRFAALVALGAGVVVLAPSPAHAASGSVGPAVVSSFQSVTVSFSALKPNQPLIVTVCRDTPQTDPAWTYHDDCSPNTADANGTTGTGGGTRNYTNVFVGAAPDDPSQWACLPPGGSPPATNDLGIPYTGGPSGIRNGGLDGQGHVTTGVGNGKVCYLRVTDVADTNVADQFFVPIAIGPVPGGGTTTTGPTTTAGATTTTAATTTLVSGAVVGGSSTTADPPPPVALPDLPWVVAGPVVTLGGLALAWGLLRRRAA